MTFKHRIHNLKFQTQILRHLYLKKMYKIKTVKLKQFQLSSKKSRGTRIAFMSANSPTAETF